MPILTYLIKNNITSIVAKKRKEMHLMDEPNPQHQISSINNMTGFSQFYKFEMIKLF